MARGAFRAAPADEFDAPILAYFVAAAHQEPADLACALDACAAAGLQIGRLELDGAEDAAAVHFFANAELRQLVRGAVADVDRPVFEDDLIRSALGAFQEFRGRFGAAQVDGADFSSKMKRNRRQPKAFLKHGRSEEHTSELQSHLNLVCRLLLEKKKNRHTKLVRADTCNCERIE